MSKRTVIKTSIGSGYLRAGWGKEAMIREVLSNAQDAVSMHGAVMTVSHARKTLVVETRGATLSRRNMLLGGGNKFGRLDTIGQFEEGLKLALLVAAREGISVKIRTGSEVWRPSIRQSAAFGGEEVLAITVTEVEEYFDGVRVEIADIAADEWAVERKKYLFLLDDDAVGRVQPSEFGSTDILTHPSQKGRVYVKGVFVQVMEDIAYGYDLRSAKVDRDRKMVDQWDARYAMTEALSVMSAKDKKVAKTLYQQAKLGKGDGAGYSLAYVNGDALDAIVEAFDDEFGEEAVACADAKQVEQLRYLGVNAAVVPERLREAIEKKRGLAKNVAEKKLSTPAKTVTRSEMTLLEAQNLDMGMAVLAEAGYTAAVDVVVFHDEAMLGKFVPCTGMISVARKALGTLRTVVAVLVHEIAHRESGAGDGSIEHARAIEEIWEKVWSKAFGV